MNTLSRKSQVRQLIQQIEFIHLRDFSMSFGVYVKDGQIYLIGCFANEAAGDVFNRRIANTIIANRLLSYIDDESVAYVFAEKHPLIQGGRIRNDKDRAYAIASILRDEFRHGNTNFYGNIDEEVWPGICEDFRNIMEDVDNGLCGDYLNEKS